VVQPSLVDWMGVHFPTDDRYFALRYRGENRIPRNTNPATITIDPFIMRLNHYYELLGARRMLSGILIEDRSAEKWVEEMNDWYQKIMQIVN
jgi:hypothetical protein